MPEAAAAAAAGIMPPDKGGKTATVDPCVEPRKVSDRSSRMGSVGRNQSVMSSGVAPSEAASTKKKFGKRPDQPMVKIADQRLVHDEEWEETHEAEVQAEELIQYLKDKWKVEIDRTSSLLEMSMRTIEISHHQRPENHWLMKRAEEKQAEHTGFFSSVRRPYSALGPPELDVPMLVFRNLPETLKIDCAEWIETQFERAEEIRKANALLPRLPHNKSSKPTYFKGRIKKGAGGSIVVDKFVKAAEDFQRGIRGSMTYTKLLEQWRQNKEDETASRGSAFGVVKRSPLHAETATTATSEASHEASMKKEMGSTEKGRKSSMLDDKAYQVEMLNLEKMIRAMYDIIKSMLNIKQRQLRSDLRLAHTTVMQLRSHSPETRLKHKKSVPAAQMLRNRRMVNRKKEPEIVEEFEEDEDEDEDGDEEEEEGMLSHAEAVLKISQNRLGKLVKEGQQDLNAIFKEAKKKYRGTGHVVPRPFNPVTTAEIYPLSETSSAEQMSVAIDRVKTIIDSYTYLDDRPFELLSATVEKEATEVTALRKLKNDERFRNIFDRKSVTPEPIWHDVRIRHVDNSGKSATDGFKAGRKHSDPTASMINFQLIENKTDTNLIPHTLKIPDENDILTPALPGAVSEEVLDSEEQSRVNLLTKIPGAASDEPPPSPIRRLMREAGIKTTEKDMFSIIMNIKRPFRQSEKNLRLFYTNEIEKYEWDTMKRYKAKVQAIFPDPIYEYSIETMREFAAQIEDDEVVDEDAEKRPAIWYRELLEKCENLGAMKHHGCSEMIIKLHKYCDVDTKSRPNMLNRFCLLVVSLPTNELGTPYFQQAFKFLLERLFGSPKELLHEWLSYRGLPYLC